MKLRHAVALALLVWYLMVAPRQSFENGQYHEASLGKWTHKATFHSELECKQEILKGCHHFQNGEIEGLEGPLCFARCVAGDDPQLKGN